MFAILMSAPAKQGTKMMILNENAME